MKQGHTMSESVKTRLLVVDDEENMRHMLSVLLVKAGYRVDTAMDGSVAAQMAAQTVYDYVLCDLRMPNMGGMAFLKAFEDRLHETTVIVMSAYGTIDLAIEAMKLGAYDFISKPFKTDEVLLTLKKAEERKRLKKENRRLKARIQKIQGKYTFGDMVGRSPAIKSVFKLAEKASRFDTTVLITGESGTGKELVAKALHAGGQRNKKAFVAVNCGGIPETLLDSELFGYVKGAFTGADRNKKGLFEEAGGGTIFLDEIGELPLSLQVKLLRVLQENEIRAVGDAKTRKIDVRVIAATARMIEDEVGRGTFREDLFYRLNVLRIHIPPLREWREDIPLLCRHFIDLFNEKLGGEVRGIHSDAAHFLAAHNWPGNVRELENVIERAFVLSDGPVLLPESFPKGLGNVDEAVNLGDALKGYSLKAAQKVVEKKLIIKALRATAGNRTRAGKLLEISHPSLLSKMKTYGIDM